MNARSKKRRGFIPALQDATPADKGVVVSRYRARWKARHHEASEAMIRMVRFVWMRALSWDDRDAPHGGVLGACLRAGFLSRRDDRLGATPAGKKLLDADREARS